MLGAAITCGGGVSTRNPASINSRISSELHSADVVHSLVGLAFRNAVNFCFSSGSRMVEFEIRS